MAACSKSPLRFFLSIKTSRVICNRNVQVNSEEATSRYPPILPSRTAKSKSAKRRLLLESFERLRTVEPEHKIEGLTRIQRMKYVVYPQTFALGADKWYQHYTKTAFLPGLPHKFGTGADGTAEVPMMEESVVSAVRSAVWDSLLQEFWYMKKGRTFAQKVQNQFAEPFLKNAVTSVVSSLASQNPVLGQSSLGESKFT